MGCIKWWIQNSWEHTEQGQERGNLVCFLGNKIYSTAGEQSMIIRELQLLVTENMLQLQVRDLRLQHRKENCNLESARNSLHALDFLLLIASLHLFSRVEIRQEQRSATSHQGNRVSPQQSGQELFLMRHGYSIDSCSFSLFLSRAVRSVNFKMREMTKLDPCCYSGSQQLP